MSKEDIWKTVLELAEEEIEQTTQQEGEMTVSEFSEISGMSRNRARRFLDRKVESGELEIRIIPLNGGTRLYKPIHEQS